MTQQQTQVALRLIALLDGVESLDWNPDYERASALCERSGLVWPLSHAIFWDCTAVHGFGDDRDSLPCIAARSRPRHASEIIALTYFLHERRRVLLCATDPGKRKEFRALAPRIAVWEQLLLSQNWHLETPLVVATPHFKASIE